MLHSDFVSQHITPAVNRTNYENNVWLGGQDVDIEGQFVWTSSGGQPLSNDLRWGDGRHLYDV